MTCLTCRHFAPTRVASVANATIVRIKPCVVSDFDPRLLGTLTPPMTDDAFKSAIKTYYCEQWEDRSATA